MSRRKISSESFSSLGSDCPETSPEEEGECPLSRLCWNGSRSPPGPAEPPLAAAAAAVAAASAGARRAPRRRRVNLDSLGESIRRLTAPAVSAPRPPGLLTRCSWRLLRGAGSAPEPRRDVRSSPASARPARAAGCGTGLGSRGGRHTLPRSALPAEFSALGSDVKSAYCQLMLAEIL